MGEATEEQLNNPLHGVKLKQILEHLEKELGWEEMALEIPINCFKTRPSIKSSLHFLRRTEWARKKVENLYLDNLPEKIHPSVTEMWTKFTAQNPDYNAQEIPESWNFCDNEKDANECAELVIKGIKQATSTSLWWFETFQEDLPEVDNVYIVTNWNGEAKAIIKTIAVNQRIYRDITEKYAAKEGEGDQSLAYWKKVHWDYYSREMEAEGQKPDENMLIVCEEFETIWAS